MVRDFSGTVYDQDVNVEVDTSNIFPGDTHSRSATKVLLNQIVVAGRILLELLTKVNKVHLTLNLPYTAVKSWVDTTACKLLALEPLSTCRLIPCFDSLTAHRLHLPCLQQLAEFDFAGSEFHWALAKLPCLRKLRLDTPLRCSTQRSVKRSQQKTHDTRDICSVRDTKRRQPMLYHSQSIPCLFPFVGESQSGHL